MISTEREYVRSLSYIIEHYFPEMERLDLPQDLRGKRSIIFGNVEKLWDFHSQYFSKELEASAHSPLSISSCFLRHVSLDRHLLGTFYIFFLKKHDKCVTFSILAYFTFIVTFIYVFIGSMISKVS